MASQNSCGEGFVPKAQLVDVELFELAQSKPGKRKLESQSDTLFSSAKRPRRGIEKEADSAGESRLRLYAEKENEPTREPDYPPSETSSLGTDGVIEEDFAGVIICHEKQSRQESDRTGIEEALQFLLEAGVPRNCAEELLRCTNNDLSLALELLSSEPTLLQPPKHELPVIDVDALLAHQLQLEDTSVLRSPQVPSYSPTASLDRRVATRLQQQENLLRAGWGHHLRSPSPHGQIRASFPRTPQTHGRMRHRMRGHSPALAGRLSELLHRELTENDYELLLLLDGGQPHTKGAPDHVVRCLPTRVVDADNPAPGPCVICFEDIAVGAVVRVLPCCHQFHTDCIDPWLRVNKVCPIDKKQIDDPGSDDVTGTATTTTTSTRTTTTTTTTSPASSSTVASAHHRTAVDSRTARNPRPKKEKRALQMVRHRRLPK